jgi:hypothetical protein
MTVTMERAAGATKPLAPQLFPRTVRVCSQALVMPLRKTQSGSHHTCLYREAAAQTEHCYEPTLRHSRIMALIVRLAGLVSTESSRRGGHKGARVDTAHTTGMGSAAQIMAGSMDDVDSDEDDTPPPVLAVQVLSALSPVPCHEAEP